MKGKVSAAIGIMLCLALIISLPLPAFALTDRAQYNEQGGFVPNSFAEGDALRYGGLFGPLEEGSDRWELWAIERRNPELTNPFQNWARDMGFGRDQSRYIPINRRDNPS